MTTTKTKDLHREELLNKKPRAKNGYKTRSEAVGNHTAKQQSNKIKNNAIATAQALARLEALETVNEYNRIKADGTYFNMLSEAFETNGASTLRVIEARIEELQVLESEIDYPLLKPSTSVSDYQEEELN